MPSAAFACSPSSRWPSPSWDTPGRHSKRPAPPQLEQALASASKRTTTASGTSRRSGYQSLLDQAVAARADLWEGRALLGLASVDYNRSKYADATATLNRAEVIFERLGAAWEIGETESTFGRMAQVAGNRARSRASLSTLRHVVRRRPATTERV